MEVIGNLEIKGVVDQYYITNYLERIIKNYIEKIESLVLIGNLKEVSLKVNGYKEKVDKIYTLEKENKELRQVLNELNGKTEKMEEIIEKVPHVLGLYNIINELFSKNKRAFEFIVENKDIDLDLLTESISKTSTDLKTIPKQKDKGVKGFNLKSK